jgi:hypothetical protein
MLESAMQRMKLEGEDPNLFSPSNRRHEPRLPLTFPIEVSGLDRAGHFFTEQSSCSDVGEASCAFRLRADLEEDAVVAIRSFHWQNHNVLDSRPVLFQVARIEKDGEEWIVATIRLQPQRSLSSQDISNIERAVS